MGQGFTSVIIDSGINASHPFFTGQKTFVDTLGRVERFQKKFAGKYFDAKKK